MTNQSELDELYLQQTLLKLIGVKDGDPRYSDVLLIADYITANYTPNSEVEQLTPHLTPHLTPKKLPRFEP